MKYEDVDALTRALSEQGYDERNASATSIIIAAALLQVRDAIDRLTAAQNVANTEKRS